MEKFKHVHAVHAGKSSTYVWKAPFDMAISVGDYVVVKVVPYGHEEEISTIVKVVEIEPELHEASDNYREVIAVADRATAEIFFNEKKIKETKPSFELDLVSPTRGGCYTVRDALLKGKARAGLWCDQLKLVRYERTSYGDYDFIVEVANMRTSTSYWSTSINFVVPSLTMKGHVTGNGDVHLGYFGSWESDISASALSAEMGMEFDTPYLATEGFHFTVDGEDGQVVAQSDLTKDDNELLLELVKELVYRELVIGILGHADPRNPITIRE
nr:MAG TPA: hypothetical protein [Caudoviricetes sp.]